MEAKPELDSELESFRQQWRSELKTKQPEDAKKPTRKTVASSSKTPVLDTFKTSVPHANEDEDEDDEAKTQLFEAPGGFTNTAQDHIHPEAAGKVRLVSALDHFEAAVNKEAIGKLGDSLKLYRRAFRLDSRVDMAYRKKHHAAQWQKQPAPPVHQADHAKTVQSESASTTEKVHAVTTTPVAASAPAPAPPPAPATPQTQSLTELISSFAGLSVAPAPPPVEGDPAPPCPISELPQEILTHIITEVAVLDVADFVRLSLVCKRFAYLVATESQAWRRVCAGTEFGFQGMHYHYQTGITWEALDDEVETEDGEIIGAEELAQRRQEASLATTLSLFPEYGSSWKSMFRNRPRIRFNGCYISTVNYLRPGQASVNQVTWGSPVHIITYYRYLRFFRDGTVISLLTTAEPGDVVHHLTKEHLVTRFKGDTTHPEAVVSKNGLKGRWRLSTILDKPEAAPKECDSELFIETEGAIDKYDYRMDLSIRSAGKGARNNKLVWNGFYSYNKLTDDWSTFGLKNDKPFFFSRVKSYGVRGA